MRVQSPAQVVRPLRKALAHSCRWLLDYAPVCMSLNPGHISDPSRPSSTGATQTGSSFNGPSRSWGFSSH